MKTTNIFIALTFTATAMFFASCSRGRESDNVSIVVEKVWDYGQKNPEGFTIDIRTFETPTVGIVVSYTAMHNCFEKKDLPKVIEHAYSHANIVGGWYNKTNQKYYYDSDTIFQESMLKEAIEWGRKNGQQSVFILSEKREVGIED